MEQTNLSSASLGGILTQGAEVFEQARAALPDLPKADSKALLVPTFAEAQAIVHNRDEEKRKAAAKRDKHKQRVSKSKDLSVDVSFPGAIPGGEADTTAFWLATEGYFRDVAEEDVAALVSDPLQPLEDPIFSVPAPGPPFVPERERTARDAQPRAFSILKPKTDVESQADEAETQGQEEAANGTVAGDADKRKSRRVAARSNRETDALARRLMDEDAILGAELEATMAGMTSSGQLAEYLLQTVKERDVALLASQVLALCGVDITMLASVCGVPTEQLARWMEAGALTSSRDKPIGEAGLPAEAQIKIHDWIASRAMQLSLPAAQGSDAVAPVPVLRQSSLTAMETDVPGLVSMHNLPESWKAWRVLLEGEQPPVSPRRAVVHPYAEAMLDLPPTVYVQDPGALGPSRNGGAATPSGLTPTPSDTHGTADPSALLDTATAATATKRPGRTSKKSKASTSGQQQRVSSPAPLSAGFQTPAPVSAADRPGTWPSEWPSKDLDGTAPLSEGTPRMGPFPPTPDATASLDHAEDSERLASNAEAGPSGSKVATRPRSGTGWPKKKSQSLGSLLNKTAKKAGSKLVGPAIDPTRNAVTAAVAACIAAGPEEGDIEAQWQQLETASELLAVAPDDEVLAEMLALQSDLLQQMAINRARAAALLTNVLPDLPRQRGAARAREEGVEVAKTWIAKQRAVKRTVKREKREAAQREAQKAAEAFLQISPRKAPGRMRGASVDASGPPSTAPSPPPEGPLGEVVDLLAERGAEEEALCAVCSGGDSNKLLSNEIVFCERCDVAVHQKCYGVEEIPAGEWLCWPCKQYEEAELRKGVAQADIRPPRWELASARPLHTKEALPGGARSTRCLLCPVRRGAFRQTIDAKHWVHQVCALWHSETSVRPGPACAVVEGVGEIRAERWGVECAICGRTEGAILRCNAGHCATAYHPLCGRNNGQYLAIREGPAAGRSVYRSYCALHSEAQREKDLGHAIALEGPASVLRKEAKRRQALDRANAAALEALEERQAERATLTRTRLDLESLRILLQRVVKRERLKREELRTSQELMRGRLRQPDWVPSPASPPGEDGLDGEDGRYLGSGGADMRGKRARARAGSGGMSHAVSMQVDRECMMTTGEAAATNTKLPPGFMYVPYDSLRAPGNEDPPP